MEIHDLKNSLVKLVFQDLLMLGIDLDGLEENEGVQLYTTSDSYNEEFQEATWIAAVNQDDTQVLCLIQGSCLNKENEEEIEIGRVMIDDNKAEMLIDALYHTHPDLIYDKIAEAEEEGEEEEEEEEGEELSTSEINSMIGAYKKEIHRLEKLRDSVTETADADDLIDAYKKVKSFASNLKQKEGECAVVKRKNNVIFASSFKEDKLIKLVEANVSEIASQGTATLPGKKISNSLLIDRKLAKVLLKKISETFK